jgi:Flp pilus assembly protein TadG
MTLAPSELCARLRGDTRALALTEFALMLPIFITMCLGGTEIANYITTKMRMSQIALQIADNAARIGTGSKLAAKTISEVDINDVFAGAQVESGSLNLGANGRIILSDLEPIANPNPTGKFKIVWQRCYGTKTTHGSTYGNVGQTNMDYMGTAARQTKALPDSASMFVEVYYVYKPIVSTIWTPSTELVETASMAVRDRRNLTTPPNNTAGATIATC